MTEPLGRHRIRKFLASRKHKRQPSEPEDLRASITSSITSLPESTVVAMEGSLKKRLAKMPIMHDRYCVATWELDAEEHKRVILRSYKSRKAYDGRPEKPWSVQELKCISDWDGKTGFHRYQHAFTIETRDKKLYQCVAPCAADKVKWMGLMDLNSRRDMRLGSVGNFVSFRRTQSVESLVDSGKPRAYTGPSESVSVNADQSTDIQEQINVPDQDRLFRTTSVASANSSELLNRDKNEPVDWGLCGNEDTTFKYEVQEDSKPVLLEKELLDSRGETKTLATDRFLFEEAGASRFGAVIVKGAERDNEDDDEDFVDEDFVVREAQKENEKNMKRRAQKLESNRDRYAEMAAARLAGMRKDARHPKKRHSHSHIRLSVSSEESDVGLHDEDQSVVGGEVEGFAELEDANQRRSSLRSRRSSKSQKKSFVSGSENASSVNNGYASDEDEDEEEAEEEEEDAVPSAAVVFTPMAEIESAEPEKTEADILEAKELRQLKKKYRAERRAKKRLVRENKEEERTALEAAELARAHREEQRAREEAKAREEHKKERREIKQNLKREKAKQRQAEAEFRKLAELHQIEEKRRERERREKKEKKEKKKTSKRKEKYTPPAERIQRKEVRDAERAAAADEAEPSNALVVVKKLADTETVQQQVAVSEPTPAPTLMSTSSVQTEAAPTQQAAFACSPTFPSPSPVPAPVAAPAVASSFAAVGAAATAQVTPVPMYQMSPPPFVPSYPTGSQSMPAYGLAATFGAYPPYYLAPYSYGGPTGLQPALMRPNMGFVAGLSAMNSFGTAVGPAPAPSIQNSAEPMIGPQLPVPRGSAEASSTGGSPPSFPPPPPSSGNFAGPKLTNLPELPDVIEF